MQKYKDFVINVSDWFSDLMNIVLLLAMIAIISGVVALFVTDVISFFRNAFAEGVGTMFGDLLVLWVLMELLHTQTEYIKGGKFSISVFIMVAMVAFIRKLMVVSVKLEKMEIAYFPLLSILVLGIIYWLVRRSETG